MNQVTVGTLRWDVPARAAAGGTNIPGRLRTRARTAQRAVPAACEYFCEENSC